MNMGHMGSMKRSLPSLAVMVVIGAARPSLVWPPLFGTPGSVRALQGPCQHSSATYGDPVQCTTCGATLKHDVWSKP